MKITQIASILDSVIVAEGIGQGGLNSEGEREAIVKEDLSNIVDVGRTVLDYTDNTTNFDSFISKLIDQIGRVIFVDRPYTSQAPNILKDGWEYGSVLQKVRCELQESQDNATWDLSSYLQEGGKNGETYPDPFELSPPNVEAKFYNSKVTFEVPITLTQVQLKQAFRSASDMNRFFAMIENRIAMKMTLSTDALIMRTINNLIGCKIADNNNVVNLLDGYKELTGNATLTASEARTNADFLRYAAKTMMLYKKYLESASTLYNDSDYVTFTPADKLKFVALADFSKSMDTYLYSDVYHNEFVKLPGFEEVGYWQSVGTSADNDESYGTRSSIKATVIKNDNTTADVDATGIVGVMFDEEAAMVANENYRVTSIYNPRGEYTNYFYKWDAMYLNDLAENCVVFVIQ